MFDLDGTVTDSALGITNSVMHALNKYGIAVNERSELNRFVGPPLHDSFKNFYGFSNEEANKAVAYYREYYVDKGIFENTVYDGIEELFQSLKENGRRLVLATSKPEIFAKQILEYFNLAKYFTYIAGSNLDGTRTKKDEVIKYALESCKITDLTKSIMIGDREYDILGAKKVGIDSIGVLYGYGDSNELEKAEADYIVHTVDEIGKILLDE